IKAAKKIAERIILRTIFAHINSDLIRTDRQRSRFCGEKCELQQTCFTKLNSVDDDRMNRRTIVGIQRFLPEPLCFPAWLRLKRLYLQAFFKIQYNISDNLLSGYRMGIGYIKP